MYEPAPNIFTAVIKHWVVVPYSAALKHLSAAEREAREYLEKQFGQSVNWSILDQYIEKYLRDATSFMHSDGTNQVCLLRAARAIATGNAGREYGY